MKVCAYVQSAYAKQNYKLECMDTRQFVGLRVVIDCLTRAGYEVEFAGESTVHKYDVVLVSITADCDWWAFIAERLRWQPGGYKVLVGGAGVLHVTPFTRWFHAAMLGRGEDLIVPLVAGIASGVRYEHDSIVYADSFTPAGVYYVCQAQGLYPHKLRLSDARKFEEDAIGCNHKCLFCGYTWQRRFQSVNRYFAMSDSLFGGMADKERAMLDLAHDPDAVDWAHLRTTAIDGFSERLRVGVGNRITRDVFLRVLASMLAYDGKPHQIKIYNICGYPSETEADWYEYTDTLREADAAAPARMKQWSIVLHNTPFRPMPATPMACAPASKRNYRGVIGSTLGPGLKGQIIYQGSTCWSVESMGTDSLQTVMLSMLAHRGSAEDSENIARLCATKAFWSASSAVKEATLCKYFDMDALFASFTPDTLPSRYLRTYAQVEKLWGHTPLEEAARRG